MTPVILDCGAFSAFRQGVDLNVDDYIAYVRRNSEFLHAYASLDVISGTNGHEDSAARSYENHQRMKDAGLTPIPVFHQGDGW